MWWPFVHDASFIVFTLTAQWFSTRGGETSHVRRLWSSEALARSDLQPPHSGMVSLAPPGVYSQDLFVVTGSYYRSWIWEMYCDTLRRTLLTCAVPALVSSLQVWDGLMCETLNTDNINNSFSYIQYTLHCLCSMKQFCWWNYVIFLLPQVLQYYKQWLELLGSWLSSPHCLPQLDLCLSVSHLDYLKRIFHIIFEC